MIIIVILAGLIQLSNGLFMLVSPELWYRTIPGVLDTGPANIHFIRDIGIAFTVSGATLLAGVRRLSPAFILVGAAFPAGHALLHLAEAVFGHGHQDVLTLVALLIPALLPLSVMIRGKSR